MDFDNDGAVNVDEFIQWWQRAKGEKANKLVQALNRLMVDPDSGTKTGKSSLRDKVSGIGSAGKAVQSVDRAKMNRFLQATVFGAPMDDGDMDADAKKELLLKKEWFGLLHPDTPIRQLYDAVQLFILLYLFWVLPNRIAFLKSPKGWEALGDVAIDGTVWLDILLSMNMYYYDTKTKKLVTDKAKIKGNYLRSWFLVDLFSVLPADQIMLIVGKLLVVYAHNDQVAETGYLLQESSQAARLLRLVRLLRLAKLAELLNVDKVVHILFGLFKNLGVTRMQLEFYFRVTFLVLIMLCASHILGCVFLLIGRYKILNVVTAEGWMLAEYGQYTNDVFDLNKTKDFIQCIGGDFVDSEYNAIHGHSCSFGKESFDRGANASIFSAPKQVCAPVPEHNPYDVDCSWIFSSLEVPGATGSATGVGAAQHTQYLAAFYFSLVTLSTVGFGDITPSTPIEKEFVVMAILVGAFMYAYIIGEFSDLIQNLKREKSKFDAKMRSVNDLLAYIDAPLETRSRVQDFYEFKFDNREGVDILDELPTGLQTTMVKHRWGKLVATVPFFSGLKDGVVTELCKRMQNFTVVPGDLIMEAGEEHDELLMLYKGIACTKPERKGATTVFEVGTFWGELQFLGKLDERHITVIATTYCEIAALNPSDIADILEQHAGLRRRLEAYGTMRMEIETKIAEGVPFDMQQLQEQLGNSAIAQFLYPFASDNVPPCSKTIHVRDRQGRQTQRKRDHHQS
jgi:hypothetical protein